MSIILAGLLAVASAPAQSASMPAAAAPEPVKLAVAFDGLPWSADNVFARIVRGELPVAKVYEDAHVLVFMDNHPRAPGHALVISKTAHARNILEMRERDLDRVMAVVRRVAAAERIAFHPAGIILQQNNGVAQSVPHLHVHVIPVYQGEALLPPESAQASLPELEANAAQLRAALADSARLRAVMR